MKLRFAAIAVLPLALAACDDAAMTDLKAGLGMKPEVAEQPETPPGPPVPPSVSPLEQPIELAGGEQIAAPTAQAETLNTTAFTARGNEPFWSADASGDTVVYKTPENQTGRRISVRRLNFAGGVEFIGVLDGAAFALTVRGTDCVDDMSGEKFPMSSTLKIGGRMSNGCAAPAAAATPAAAAEAEVAATQG